MLPWFRIFRAINFVIEKVTYNFNLDIIWRQLKIDNNLIHYHKTYIYLKTECILLENTAKVNRLATFDHSYPGLNTK